MDGKPRVVKRRQQGILTGMPFMANVSEKTFTDDIGRRVYLAKPARRVVSLAPSVTEILFAVGLDAEVVGVTTFCDYPPAAKAKPKVGSSIQNLEAIIGLKPDLVLAVKSEIVPVRTVLEERVSQDFDFTMASLLRPLVEIERITNSTKCTRSSRV